MSISMTTVVASKVCKRFLEVKGVERAYHHRSGRGMVNFVVVLRNKTKDEYHFGVPGNDLFDSLKMVRIAELAVGILEEAVKE